RARGGGAARSAAARGAAATGVLVAAGGARRGRQGDRGAARALAARSGARGVVSRAGGALRGHRTDRARRGVRARGASSEPRRIERSHARLDAGGGAGDAATEPDRLGAVAPSRRGSPRVGAGVAGG